MSKNNPVAEERYYRLAEVTEHPLVKALGLGRRVIERAIYRGDLRSVKPGLARFVSDSAIREWIEGSRPDAPESKRPTASK